MCPEASGDMCPCHSSDTWLTSRSAGGSRQITWVGNSCLSPASEVAAQGTLLVGFGSGDSHVTRGEKTDAFGFLDSLKQSCFKIHQGFVGAHLKRIKTNNVVQQKYKASHRYNFKFSGSYVKTVAGETNFKGIFQLSRHIQIISHQYIINIKLLRRHSTFFFSYNVSEIQCVLCTYSTSWLTPAIFQGLETHVGSIQVFTGQLDSAFWNERDGPGSLCMSKTGGPNPRHTKRTWETGHQKILFEKNIVCQSMKQLNHNMRAPFCVTLCVCVCVRRECAIIKFGL